MIGMSSERGEAIALRESEIREFCGFKPENPTLWLSDPELVRLRSITDFSYRNQFALVRLIAKTILRKNQIDQGDFRELTIRSWREDGKRVTPIVSRNGDPLPVRLSLSHLDGILAAAVIWGEWEKPIERGMNDHSPIEERSLPTPGIDLVRIGTVSPPLIRQYFTQGERELLAREEKRFPEKGLPEAIWGAKEAFYKAFLHHRAFQPLRIETVDWRLGPDDRSNLVVRSLGDATFDREAEVQIRGGEDFLMALCGLSPKGIPSSPSGFPD